MILWNLKKNSIFKSRMKMLKKSARLVMLSATLKARKTKTEKTESICFF